MDPYLKLGKKPATQDPRDLRFATYRTSALPTPPAQYGHETIVGARAWGMLGNDQWGDCAWAGPAHETMILTDLGSGSPVQFTTEAVLSDYGAGTGFDPNAGPPGSNPTDQGSNVRDVLKYRASKGIVDAAGHRHKIGAYVQLKSLQEALEALYLFEAVGLGFEVPAYAMDQFNAGKPWDIDANADGSIEGGHYVPLVAKRQNLVVVTWGAVQQMTARFYEKFVDEAWAYISAEALQSGKTPEGFDLGQLQTDLQQLR